MERSEKLLEMRPLISKAKLSSSMSDEERFQNNTLRPLLKLQNDLLLVSFQNYILRGKNKFYELSLEQKLAYISNAFKKDIKYRNGVHGMIIGHFTLEEYEEYLKNASALNRRITNMVIKRIEDQIQIFDKSVSLIH